MKQDYHPMDDLFKRKLGDFASETPMHIWDRIEKKRRDRKVFFFLRRGGIWLLLASVLSTSLLGYYLYQQSIDNNSTTTKIKSIDKTSTLSEIATNQQLINPASSSAQNSDKTTSAELEKSEIVSTEKVVTNEKSRSPLREKKKTTTIIYDNESNSNSKTFGNSTVTAEQNNSFADKQIVQTERATTLNERTNQNASIGLVARIKNLAPIDGIESFLIESDENDDEDLMKFWNPDCYSFRGGRSKPYFFVDAIYAPQYASKTLSTITNDPEQVDYANNRNDTESYSYAYSLGARLSMLTKSKLALRTGLTYSQITEKFNFRQEHVEGTVEITIKDSAGNIIGTQIDTLIGTRIKTTYNRYHFIDVPVLLGYEIHGEKININLNAGAYFNVAFSQKGDILDPDLIPTKLSESGHPVFRDKVGVSIYGSVSLNYNLTDRIQILMEPHVRHYLNPITAENYPIEQKYTVFGVYAGMRYNF